MNQSEIAQIIRMYGPARWIEGDLVGLPGEGWFLLETNPLPPMGEFAGVISDIVNDRNLIVDNGQVRHQQDCNDDHGLPDELKFLPGAGKRIAQRSFKIAIHPGIDNVCRGQPLAFAFEPAINYERYPDHPHLNTANYMPHSGGSKAVFVPDSICYTDDVVSLRTNSVDRFTQSFAYVTIWLLRHMIWEETRRLNGNGIWIGPQGPPFQPHGYITALNPTGACRCGNGRRYMQCHLPKDIQFAERLPVSQQPKTQRMDYLLRLQLHWNQKRKVPQDKFYAEVQNIVTKSV